MRIKYAQVLNVKNMQIFSAIAENGSLTRTAKLLNRSQGQLSSIVKEIERVCGTPLFKRASSGVVLTYAGELFLQESQRYIDAYHNLSQFVQQISECESKQVILYAPPGVIHFLAEQAMHILNVVHPEISLLMRAFQLGEVDNYDYLFNDGDIIISMLPSSHPDAVNVMLEQDMGFYVSPTYYQIGDIKCPQDLLAEQCITIVNYGVGSNLWSYNDNAENKVINVSGKYQANDLHSAISMAKAGLGVIFIPCITAIRHVENGGLVRVLADCPSKKAYYVIHRKHKHISDAALSVRDFLLGFVS